MAGLTDTGTDVATKLRSPPHGKSGSDNGAPFPYRAMQRWK